jgi:phage terminase large subunit
MSIISDILEIIEYAEKAKGYWDETGLDMHIAVVPANELSHINTRIAVKTKHWGRKHYINSFLNPHKVWEILRQISKKVGRSLIKSQKGDYVYINKLNIEHTQSIFDIMKKEFGNDIDRVWELKWDIEGAVLP